MIAADDEDVGEIKVALTANLFFCEVVAEADDVVPSVVEVLILIDRALFCHFEERVAVTVDVSRAKASGDGEGVGVA